MKKIIGWLCFVTGILAAAYYGLLFFGVVAIDLYRMILGCLVIASISLAYGGFVTIKEKSNNSRILVVGLLSFIFLLMAAHFAYDPKADFIW
jgi:hypothetical protein